MNYCRWSVTLALVLQAGIATAQTLPLGGRTASMGGAAAAAGRDGAMPYVNPAGFALVPSSTVTLSASLYRFEVLEIEDFFLPGSVDPEFIELNGEMNAVRNRLSSSHFGAFPGAASALWHFGSEDPTVGSHHVLSGTIIVSSNKHLTLGGDFALATEGGTVTQASITRLERTTQYDFGPGYAFRQGPLRLGVGVMFAYTASEISQRFAGRATAGNNFVANEATAFRDAESLGLQPVLGAQWSPLSGFSVGASLATPTLPLTGTVNGQSESQTVAPPELPDGTSLSAAVYEGSFERNRPMRLRAGVAYQVPKAWSLAADVALLVALDRATVIEADRLTATQVQGLPAEVTSDRDERALAERASVNVHLGGEVFLSEFMALRSGAFFEPSTTILENTSQNVLNLQVSQLGFSLGLGLEDESGEVTFGSSFAFGRGRTVVVDAFSEPGVSNTAFVDVNSYALNAFISGAVDVGDFSLWARAAREPARLFDVETRSISLSDLDADLPSALSGPEFAPLPETRVSCVVSGVPEFDRFFERVARIRLAAQVAPTVVAEFARAGEFVAEAAAARPDLRKGFAALWLRARGQATTPPVDLPDAERLDRVARAAVATERVLGALLRDVASLPAAGQALVHRAQEEFRGPRVILLPAVLKNLGVAQSDLLFATQQFPTLLAALNAARVPFVGKVTWAGTLPDVPTTRSLTLSELTTALSGDQGTADYDALSTKPIQYEVWGVAEVDAYSYQAARLDLAVAQLRHGRSVLDRLVATATPNWKRRGRPPARVLAQLSDQVRDGKTEPSDEVARLELAGEIFRVLLNVKLAGEAARAFLADSTSSVERMNDLWPALAGAGNSSPEQLQRLRASLDQIASRIAAARGALPPLLESPNTETGSIPQ